MPIIFDSGTNAPQLLTTCPTCGTQGKELIGQQAMLPGRRMFHCSQCRQDFMEHAPQESAPRK